MKITTEQKDALNSMLHVHVTPEDYKGQVDEQVKKYARQAKMPGFRPGKVPKGMVRKMLGLGVVMEEVSKAVSQAISEHIRDNKLQVLGDPMPTEMKGEDAFDLECTKDIDFEFELGLAPEFELNLELKDPVKVFEVEIDDKILDKEIHDQRDRHGELIYPENVEMGDIVFGKLTVKGQEEADGKLIVVNENRFPEKVNAKKVFKPILGKKVDDIIDFDMSLFGKKEQIMKALMLDE